MQTVAAQWVMTTLTTSAFLVGAIQATNLPVLLLAVPGGVLGDLLNRKKLILAGQTVMLVSAAALGALDLAGLVTPAVLLTLPVRNRRRTGPDRADRSDASGRARASVRASQAIALGSVNQNLAPRDRTGDRRVLLRRDSAAIVFFVNAGSFLAVIGVVAIVSVPARVLTLPREHVGSATRAGGRFVRESPALLAIMAASGRVRVVRQRRVGVAPAWSPSTRSDWARADTGCCWERSGSARYPARPSLRRSAVRCRRAALMTAGAPRAIITCTLVLAVSHAAVLDGAGCSSSEWQDSALGRVQRVVPIDAAELGQGSRDGGSTRSRSREPAGPARLLWGLVAQATSLRDGTRRARGRTLPVGTVATFRLALPQAGRDRRQPRWRDAAIRSCPEGTVGEVLHDRTYDVAPGSRRGVPRALRID